MLSTLQIGLFNINTEQDCLELSNILENMDVHCTNPVIENFVRTQMYLIAMISVLSITQHNLNYISPYVITYMNMQNIEQVQPGRQDIFHNTQQGGDV